LIHFNMMIKETKTKILDFFKLNIEGFE